ncbi:hypothetical protein Tco_0132650 [Tanacetum coccineum]
MCDRMIIVSQTLYNSRVFMLDSNLEITHRVNEATVTLQVSTTGRDKWMKISLPCIPNNFKRMLKLRVGEYGDSRGACHAYRDVVFSITTYEPKDFSFGHINSLIVIQPLEANKRKAKVLWNQIIPEFNVSSMYVDEIVTDAVDWAMHAPLGNASEIFQKLIEIKRDNSLQTECGI